MNHCSHSKMVGGQLPNAEDACAGDAARVRGHIFVNFPYLFFQPNMETAIELLFFIGLIYWLFPNFFTEGISRINKMVDIVTNHMFDVFNKFSPRESHQNDTLSTMSALKRFSAEQKNRRKLSKEAEQKARNNLMFEIKENAPPIVVPKRRPLVGLSCYGCTPNRDSLVNQTVENFALKNILDYNPQASRYGFLQRLFKHLVQNYQLKKFDYPQCAGLVLDNERVKYAVEKTAAQQCKDADNDDPDFYAQLVKNNKKRAGKILYDMRSTLSDFLLRFTSWLLFKLLPCFVTSIVVHPGHIEMLQKVSKTNLPLIFLPLHRSHLDYILMSFILLNNNVRSPLVASGDNLRIPFFGSLLRGLGAFYIKRRIDPVMGQKDHVYKAVLHTYMNECLKAGHNIEFFLEGGRTRTGKPCMPKYGILSVIVEAFIDGIMEDALLVPVSVNYEKLVDGNFVREQLGQPKEMETFGNAMKGIWHVLNSDYGMIRVDFNQPFSLRELVKTFNRNGRTTKPPVAKKLKSNPSTTSLYGTDVVSDEHKTLVESISKHVIYDCAQSISVMSTNALAFLLLNKFRKGVTIDQLVDAVDELRAELSLIRRDVGFTGDSLDVINYAIELLGPALVRKERVNNEEVIRPVAMLPNVIELMYYCNSLTTIYSLESVIATALFSLDLSTATVNRDELIEAATELCDILQYEFLFCKPCEDLEVNIKDCIDDLVTRKEIFTYVNLNTVEAQKCRQIAQEFCDSSDEEQYPGIELKLNKKATDYLMYLRSMLRSLIEGYTVSAYCLEKLVGRSLVETELINDILNEMRKQLADGSLLYPESVSVDTVKNALKLFQKWELLECYTEKRLRLYYMKDMQDNISCVSALYNRINKFKTSSQSES